MPASRKKKTDPRVIAAAIAVPIVVFMAMNFGFFFARASLMLRGPAPVAHVPPTAADLSANEASRMAPDRLVIPSLGIEAPLMYGTEMSEAAFQLALRDGVVHYPGTAMPGEHGNAYFFGHSSDYAWAKGDYKTVFATLTSIEVGARVVVSDADGRPHDYVVTGTRVISPKDMSVLDQGDGIEARLTLQTSYPLGTALKRFVVEAKLAE